LDRTTVGTVPLAQWNDSHPPSLDAVGRADIFRRVVRAGYEILAGKGFTNYAVSLASARIVEAGRVNW
jgi:L-lactate dehydrogenase